MPSAAMVVPWIVLSIPVLAMAATSLQRPGGRRTWARRGLTSTMTIGAIGGGVFAGLYASASSARMPITQVVITCWFGVSAAVMLRCVNSILQGAADWLSAPGKPVESFANSFIAVAGRPGSSVAGLTTHGPRSRPLLEMTLGLLRITALLVIAIPVAGAIALVYRPKLVSPGTPASILQTGYEDVTFRATDGVQLRGWWIPAHHDDGSNNDSSPGIWGQRTVILCHGFGVDKATDLAMARELIPTGFNVLAFDFRAHGESDGQFSTFGDIEGRDVLGAVRWVRTHHAEQAKKIFGLGESMGATALIAAAGDRSDEGQSIDAIALFGPYDDLSSWITEMAADRHVPVAGWILAHASLPLAGLPFGARLEKFRPADLIERTAPRPVLVIATQSDDMISLADSQTLYDAASQPKYAFWLNKASRQAMMLRNTRAAAAVRVFFETARSVL